MTDPAQILDAALSALKARDGDGAVGHLRAFLDLAPDQTPAWSLLGETLLALGRPAEALDALTQALALDPDDRGALFHRARALDALDRPREALQDQEALARALPDHPEVLHNLALLRRHAGDSEGSEALLRSLLARAPDRAETRLALAHALLARGAWAEGFTHYRARLDLPGWHRPPLAAPTWDGTPLAGRSLLVTAEQGLGDGLQFLRYLPHVAGAGRLVVECHAPLARLAAALPAVDRVVPFDPESEPPATDLRVALGDLPGLVANGAPLGEVVPYLGGQGPTAKGGLGRPLRLGLAWRSSGRSELMRDPPPDLLSPLILLSGLSWTSLQWGATDSAPFPMDETAIATAKDLWDTAAIIADLDGVVTVDTAVAHLAGAMGKPVWVLLGSRPDWRWGPGGSTTPWYPSATLVRRAGRPWTTVIADLATLLARHPRP
jgi:tetratricopeptide (TPR) repeat protein